MKVRMGFVSNSSSSSFIAICKKSVLNTIEMDPFIKATLKECSREKNLENEPMIVFSYNSGDNDSGLSCVDEFAQEVINNAIDMQSPLLKEIEEAYNSEDIYDHFRDAFYKARINLNAIFGMLENAGLCITQFDNW